MLLLGRLIPSSLLFRKNANDVFIEEKSKSTKKMPSTTTTTVLAICCMISFTLVNCSHGKLNENFILIFELEKLTLFTADKLSECQITLLTLFVRSDMSRIGGIIKNEKKKK